MTAAAKKPAQRILWLEALRIIAAFLVIVNHTNSDLFKAADPSQSTWHLSILWYYLSKLAVPLFVMISGAVLLERQDSFRKVLARVGRVLIALVAASYLYFLYDAWVYWGLWPRAIRLDILFLQIARMEITDGFWYLYFYLAVLITMPLWQWLHRRMTQTQRLNLIAFCFALNAVLPLIGHYVPRLALLENPMLAYIPLGYLGLLFVGDQVRHYLTIRKHTGIAAIAALTLSLLVAWLLTLLEYGRVAPGEKYWFMDHRMIPALPVICEAIAAMVLAKCIAERSKQRAAAADEATEPSRRSKWLAEMGGCAFGIYLLQDLLIAETEKRLFLPMTAQMPAMVAVVIWEIVVFVVALAIVWLLRRIPFVRKIL
ncbi:MAG: acyltransferase [Clostridiales bacterium]|nr:acyltransferase [Clostridiales bacterium]